MILKKKRDLLVFLVVCVVVCHKRWRVIAVAFEDRSRKVLRHRGNAVADLLETVAFVEYMREFGTVSAGRYRMSR